MSPENRLMSPYDNITDFQMHEYRLFMSCFTPLNLRQRKRPVWGESKSSLFKARRVKESVSERAGTPARNRAARFLGCELARRWQAIARQSEAAQTQLYGQLKGKFGTYRARNFPPLGAPVEKMLLERGV